MSRVALIGMILCINVIYQKMKTITCGKIFYCVGAFDYKWQYVNIHLFKKYQFSFISLGVQSLDKAICEKQNRYFIPKPSLKKLVRLIQNGGMYVNLDFICFMNFGDLRDVPQFFEEMNMVLKDIKPDYVTIHTMHQSIQSIERSRVMIEQLQILIDKNQDYMCVNSLLDRNDALVDAFYSTEYRLGLKAIQYSHYMFNKYAVMPIEGYNIYALGNCKIDTLICNHVELCDPECIIENRVSK